MLGIAGILFNSQDEARAYVRNLLAKYPRGTYVTDPKDIEFLNSLVKRHHQAERKIGSGIKHFISERGMANSFSLYILRIDGSVIDISYVHCITQRKDKNSLLVAMRNAIEDQTIDFAEISDDICAMCGSTEMLHVDHKHPPFKVLAANFLKIKKKHPEFFADCPRTNRAVFKESDLEFSEEWQTYHEIHATFQILCITCNLKKGASL